MRNIGYLRFGSKILQGFAGFFTSLTPPLSLSPLWISWAQNEGAEESGGVLYLRREPAKEGGRPLPRPDSQINFIFVYKQVPTTRQGGGRGPAAPRPGGRGIEL